MPGSPLSSQPEGRLSVRNLKKSYGAKDVVQALKGISLESERGEILVLLGPSGCGKTTLLRTIAGLEDANSGMISFFGRKIVDTEAGVNLPSQRRNVGMVFQNYALWPHLTVVDNVAYPMRSRGVKKEEARAKALQTLKALQCGHLADRYPSQLSGGQQQRIALGRALAGSPEIVLFDEPLSNVDAQLRRTLRAEIRRLHQEIGFTAIYVTHDQSEGLELGDRIIVMNEGQIEQVGTPQEIFRNPATPYVAQFMGIENRFIAKTTANSVVADFGEIDWAANDVRLGQSAEHEIFIRASALKLASPSEGLGASDSRCVLRDCEVADTVFGGDSIDYVLLVGGKRLVATMLATSQLMFAQGDRVDCYFEASDASVYPLVEPEEVEKS